MTTNVRLKVLPRFPSDVIGDSGIIITKEAGVYTVSLDAVPLDVLDEGAEGYAIMGNGAGFAPTYQGFTQAGTGATARTWPDKMRDALTPEDFGAIGNGDVDDTAAITAADVAAAAQGKALRFSRVYKVTSTLTPSQGAHWIADKYQAPSGIISTSATANIIDCSNGYVSLENLLVSSSVPRTAGANVYLNDASNVTLKGLYISGAFRGIDIEGSSNVTEIVDTKIIGTIAATGVGLLINTDQYVYARGLFISGSAPFANILVSSGLLDLDFGELLGGLHGIYVNPVAGVTETAGASINIHHVYCDQQTSSGISLIAGNGSTVQRVNVVQCWMSQLTSKTGGTTGVNMVATGTGAVTGINISNSQLYGNDSGVVLVGANVTNVRINNNEIAGSTLGIYVDLATRVQISDNKIGASTGFSANTTGINLVAGASDYLVITGNEVNAVDNTTPFTNGSTGLNNKIDIAGSDNQVWRRSGSAVGFGAVNLASSNAVTGDLPFANLTQGAALTVLANATNGTADFAALAAGSDHQVLRRSGTALAFGAVNLAQAAAVTGTLPVGNGGTGITALGTGVATALGVNVGSAGAFVTFNGAGGTPSSLTLTSAIGLPIATGVSGLGTGIATALAVNTGSAGAPVLFNGAGGTPSSLTLTNATGLPFSGLTAVAWTNYTPTVTATIGTFTSVTGNGWYSVIGKIVHLVLQVVCTTVGTAAGNIRVTLPSGVDIKSGRIGIGNLYNITANYGGNVVGGLVNATSADCAKYDGTFPITTGQTCWMMFIYELA